MKGSLGNWSDGWINIVQQKEKKVHAMTQRITTKDPNGSCYLNCVQVEHSALPEWSRKVDHRLHGLTQIYLLFNVSPVIDSIVHST